MSELLHTALYLYTQSNLSSKASASTTLGLAHVSPCDCNHPCYAPVDFFWNRQTCKAIQAIYTQSSWLDRPFARLFCERAAYALRSHSSFIAQYVYPRTMKNSGQRGIHPHSMHYSGNCYFGAALCAA